MNRVSLGIKSVVALCIGACMAFSQTTITGSTLTWKVADSVLTIAGTGTMPDFGDAVNTRAPWNTKLNEVKKIVVSQGVTSIGKFAFRWLAKVTAVELPATGLTEMGTFAFANCSSLVSVAIPSSLTSVPNSAFAYNLALKSVNLLPGLTLIDGGAFMQCTSLVSVAIPSGVKTIGQSAFNGCKSLETAYIPATVDSIGSTAFNNCGKLKDLVIPEDVRIIESGAFQNCTTLTFIVVPNKVTAIKGSAFSGCKKVTYLVLGSSVDTLTNNVFKDNTALKKVVALGATAPKGKILDYNFSGLTVADIDLRVIPDAKAGYAASSMWQGFGGIGGDGIHTLRRTFDKQYLTFKVGGASQTITAAHADPAEDDGSDFYPRWMSGNIAVATVGTPENPGNVTPVGAGVTIIYDDGYSSDDSVFAALANVTKDIINAPVGGVLTLPYNKSKQGIEVAEDAKYTVSPDSGTAVGTYTSTLTLKEPTKTMWSTGTSAPYAFTWKIVKAAGGVVAAPTEGTKTTNSITITASAAPATGQVVNYAISTINAAPTDPTLWKTALVFENLLANTQYYIFARAAENDNYLVGAASIALGVKTSAAVAISNAQKSDGRYGIRLASNIVSDKAVFSVNAYGDKVLEANTVIYDNTGNVVAVKQGRGEQTWDLTNASGRKVDSGTYLMVSEVKGLKGTYAYWAKVMVKR